MILRLSNEDDILKEDVRKAIIEEINGPEEKRRRDEAFRRYRCYKDMVKIYVTKMLLMQFDPDTVKEMAYALADLGIVRKVVDKLARVYKYGVERAVEGSEDDTKGIQELNKNLNVDQVLKKTNRFTKLFKNCALYICPKPHVDDPAGKKTIKLMPLAPYLYTVIEMADEREKPLVYVLSDYKESNTPGFSVNPGRENRTFSTAQIIKPNDGKDETIADRPEDQKAFGGYVFWSKKYHFTCDDKGQILDMTLSEPEPIKGDIAPELIKNEIEELPFVNYAEDQDGAFWALGGDDLIDGAVLINSMITNINHIAITQGYGQLVMKGKQIPRSIKVGPNKAVILEYEKDDPVPEFKFETASPPLQELISVVEMYVALLLSTNNLSTSSMGAQLKATSAGAVTSGIALLIDKSESIEDVEDQRQLYVDNEPLVWSKIAKWKARLEKSNELEDNLKEINFVGDNLSKNLVLLFGEPVPLVSEAERLANLQLKVNMGLVSKIDAIKSENPGMTDDQAAEKLKQILEEKMIAMKNIIAPGGQKNESGQNGSVGGQNGFPNQPGSSGGAPGAQGGAAEKGSGGLPSGANPQQSSGGAQPYNG